MYVIGVDTGGTFTDSVVLAEDGRVAVGKALSQPHDLAGGVLASLASASRRLGCSLEQLLAGTDLMAQGTTVGLNALLTGSGSRAGYLTTAGFEDVLTIARMNKIHGLSPEDLPQATHWEKPGAVIGPSLVKGVHERVDRDGTIVYPLDEDQARRCIRDLIDEGAEAVGICLLWSFVNPSHERRLAELIRADAPDMFVAISSEVAPRLGEYERGMTVALNTYLGPTVSGYLQDLEERLRSLGFLGSLLGLHSGGGLQPLGELRTRPLETLRSGPVGGLGASLELGRRLGHRDVVATDVGGTSFDVGLVVEGRLPLARRSLVGRHFVIAPMVQMESIGTGGGSIAWLEADHALRVGPRSAGAIPGPACYGRGGEEPTLTDAAVALGYLDRMGSDLVLDRDRALSALESRIARPLSMDAVEAADGILEIASVQMGDLIRRVTLQRGHDLREFALYAYGGAAPQYVGRYAADLGVKEVVIPRLASVFSAYGAASGDRHTTAAVDVPRAFPPPVDWFNRVLGQLEEVVRRRLSTGAEAGVEVSRWAALRFRRQVHEVSVPLPSWELAPGDLAAVADLFEQLYERLHGEGTAYRAAGVELVTLAVELAIPTPVSPVFRKVDETREPVAWREAWFTGASHRCPVFDGEALAVGFEVTGPAFIELLGTCLVVYQGQTASTDELGNLRLRVSAQA